MNGGTCTENGGGYDCACPTQYSGPNCESKHHYVSSSSFPSMASSYAGGFYILLHFYIRIYS